MSPILLDIVYLVVGLPVLLFKALTTRRLRAGWRQRLGGVPSLPPQRRFWVHGASVGEILLARSVVARLEADYPDADLVLSTNTATGRETAEQHFPGRTVFYFPLDFSPVVRKVFQRIKPTAVMLIELEVWPNFVAIARQRDVPVVVVNGRITERSARRYRRLGPVGRALFRGVRHFAVQNEEYAGRLERLGVPGDRVTIAGTMKYDSVATEVAPDLVAKYRRTLRIADDDVVLLGGCTHPGEEELLIDYAKARSASGARLRLVLAPRHAERTDAVERLIREAGLLPVRKSALDAGAAPDHFDTVPHAVLVDTTGELARLYSVATLVFVGGSLIEHGGHNMIEPAALGKPVVFGPHVWNFRDTAELLTGRDAAVQVDGAGGLRAALEQLIADPVRRQKLGARARAVVEQNKGATQRNLEAIRPFLEPPEKET